MLEASDSQRFETERELEYVELEDRRSDNTRERRYLDEAPMQERNNSYREPYREPERYNEPQPVNRERSRLMNDSHLMKDRRLTKDCRWMSLTAKPAGSLNRSQSVFANPSRFNAKTATNSPSAHQLNISNSMRLHASNNVQDRLHVVRSNAPANPLMSNPSNLALPKIRKANPLMIPGKTRDPSAL